MKKITSILLSLLIATNAYAQPSFITNDDLSDLGVSEGFASPASVDSYGIVSIKVSDPTSGLSQGVIPVSGNNIGGVGAGLVMGTYITADTAEAGSTTTVINATGHSAQVGDWIRYGSTAATGTEWSTVASVTANTITVSKAFSATPVVGDSFNILRPQPAQGNLSGTLWVDVQAGQQSANSTGLLKLEDAASASGDALVGVAGVVNEAGTVLAAIGDYSAFAVNTSGAIQTNLSTNFRTPNSTVFPYKPEDEAFGDGGALMMAGTVKRAIISSGSSGDGDASELRVDLPGRVYVNPWGAGTAEFRVGCNSAITTATTGQMIAALASYRAYISSWNCTNTGGTATRVILEDGAGTDLANLFLPATSGSESITFPTPVQASATNSAVQVNVITSGSSTICCANGVLMPD